MNPTSSFRIRYLFGCTVLVGLAIAPLRAEQASPTTPPTTQKVPGVGEQVPSEDGLIKDLHSMGLIDGFNDIFRCACPVRDLAREMSTTQPSPQQVDQAKVRMQHLYDLGIRTIVSFQDSSGHEGKKNEEAAAIALESKAVAAVGIRFVAWPIRNAGPDSLETMSDQQVLQLLQAVSAEIFADARSGGVAFHCSAGHDRTGIVAAYMRMKYEHWPVEQAIAEMRRYGHNWPRFSDNGGTSSWHEQHLRSIAMLLAASN
jgi:hypothetical protein